VQTPDAQSPLALQLWLLAHLVGQLPPQSLSLSLPFFTPSVQLAAWHLLPLHTPVLQSAPVVQPWFGEQRLQEPPPPQSTSVSLPFSTMSLQVGCWQTFAEQTLLVQSLGPPQASPAGQPLQEPPQSLSLSVPFLTLSLQVGA